MTSLLQVVIPMAGLGSRFREYGFRTNKYLLPIDVSMETMIERAICSLDISVPCQYIFILREEDGPDVYLRELLGQIAKKHAFSYEIASVSTLTEGPASTVYEARHLLQPDLPLLVSNSDQVLEWDFSGFLKGCMGYDGCVLTYTPSYPLTVGAKDKHSFLRLEEGKVIRCAEKIVLSEHALVGVHYFQKASTFVEAYLYMQEHNLRAPNQEFYLSLAYQAMIEQGKTIGYVDLSEQKGTFYPVGEPEDYFMYLYQKGGYRTKFQSLIEDMVLFENDKVRVRYEVSRDDRNIKNQGFLLFLEGYADMGDICLTHNDITDGDIYTHSLCHFIHIELFDESHRATLTKERIWNVYEFTRGWFLGNFSPSILDTSDFEIGILSHTKGETWPFHYHQEADEYNVLLQGKMLLNNHLLESNTQFVLYKNEIACPFFLEDCRVLCIKSPSRPKDKHIV